MCHLTVVAAKAGVSSSAIVVGGAVIVDIEYMSMYA